MDKMMHLGCNNPYTKEDSVSMIELFVIVVALMRIVYRGN